MRFSPPKRRMHQAGRVAALVPAAGRGERLGPGAPKALREIGGQPLLVHAVHSIAQSRSVSLVVVAAPAEDVDGVRALLEAQDVAVDIRVVEGGATRQESVARALAALPAEVDVVLVHDAARALTPPELVASVAAAVLAGHPAVIPGLPVVDTLKEVDADGLVVATVDRAVLRAVQTPQGFDRAVLRAAHEAADADAPATDDAGLVEANGVAVRVIAGHEEAFKITRPLDLVLAEAVLAHRRATGLVG